MDRKDLPSFVRQALERFGAQGIVGVMKQDEKVVITPTFTDPESTMIAPKIVQLKISYQSEIEVILSQE